MAFIVVWLVLVLLMGCSGSSTSTPAASVPYETATGCCGWDTQASVGTPAKLTAAAQGFQFNFPTGPGNQIHQLVAPQTSLKLANNQAIATTFEVTGSSPVFVESDPCASTAGPALVRLYFQQTGDNWSGAGAYVNYRWWSTETVQLGVGTFTLAAALNPSLNLWSNVLGQSSSASAAGFNAAISSIQAFGLGFGGCFGSHGAQLQSGSAVFNLQNYGAH